MSLNNNILVKLENTGVMIDNKWLVKGVSLEIKKGKIVTLIAVSYTHLTLPTTPYV